MNSFTKIYDYDTVTTPMIHHHVDLYNKVLLQQNPQSNFEYLSLNESYYKKFAVNYEKILGLVKSEKVFRQSTIVDCSNGIGAKTFNELRKNYLSEKNHKIFKAINFDTASPNLILNFECGAEFVQKSRAIPKNFLENY